MNIVSRAGRRSAAGHGIGPSGRGWILGSLVLAAAILAASAPGSSLAATIIIHPIDDSCQPADVRFASCARACEADPAGCAEDIHAHVNSSFFISRRILYPQTVVDDPNPTTPMHGLFNTMYVNLPAYRAIAEGIARPFQGLELPPWSIVAKYNSNPGNDAWETHMYKIPGYCPSRAVAAADGACVGGDWFWFLYRDGLKAFDWDPTYGDLPAYGKAQAFCLDCHGAVTQSDWLWKANFIRARARSVAEPLRVDGQTPGSGGAGFCDQVVSLSPLLPPDVAFDPGSVTPPDATQRMFDCYSWEAFVALNWPAALKNRGVPDTRAPFNTPGRARVWETYKQVYETFQPRDPDWSLEGEAWNVRQPLPAVCEEALAQAPAGAMPRNAWAYQVLNERNQAYGNQFNTLTDTNRSEIRYNVRLNRPEWEYLKARGYADTGRYDYHGPLGPDIVFPDNRSGYGDVGAIEVKSAWKEMCTDPIRCNPVDDPGRYYSRYAFIYNAAVAKSGGEKPETCRVARVGLIGLHIMAKTFWAPQWIWATFEHIDNVPNVGEPVDPNTARNPYTLFNPQCLLNPPTPEMCLAERPGIFETDPPTICCQNQQMVANANPAPTVAPASGGAASPVPISNHITRIDPIGESAKALNGTFQALLKTRRSPFQYYQLVNTQWPGNGRLGADAPTPFAVSQKLCLKGDQPPCYTLLPKGLRLRNTAIETFQVSFCKPDDENIDNDPVGCTPLAVSARPEQASSAGCMNCHLPSGNDASFIWADAIEEVVPLPPTNRPAPPGVAGSAAAREGRSSSRPR